MIQTTEHGGYPLFDHLKKILAGGPIVWSPGVRGAVVVSLRGGDFLFESGQDLSIGYDRHDADRVYLYLEESFSSGSPPRRRPARCSPPGSAERRARSGAASRVAKRRPRRSRTLATLSASRR